MFECGLGNIPPTAKGCEKELCQVSLTFPVPLTSPAARFRHESTARQDATNHLRKSDSGDDNDDDDERSQRWLKEVESCECNCSSPTIEEIVHVLKWAFVTDGDRVFTYGPTITARIGQVLCLVMYPNCHQFP